MDWETALRKAHEAVLRARSGDLQGRLDHVREAQRLLDAAVRGLIADMED